MRADVLKNFWMLAFAAKGGFLFSQKFIKPCYGKTVEVKDVQNFILCSMIPTIP